MTNGEHDGRWLFINANNTPRIARIDLTRFETDEIIEIPNSAGNHASPVLDARTPNTSIAATRFSVPIPQKDVPIADYATEFKGTISFVKANEPGKMAIAFQVLMPGFDYDLGPPGQGTVGRLGLLHVVQHRAGAHQARGERVEERQGLHRGPQLPDARDSAWPSGKAKMSPGDYCHNT